jgi:hypothetical protein
MSLFLLYVLATLDGAFCGYRAAAGRSALIEKRRYYRRALQRGATLVQGAVALSAIFLACLFALSSKRDDLVHDFQAASERMLAVYLPYAAIVLVALAIRTLPSVDFRSATSVFVLGPMTALRPFVALAGVAYGILPAHRLPTRLAGIMVLALMFVVQVSLDRIAAREADLSLPASLAG